MASFANATLILNPAQGARKQCAPVRRRKGPLDLFYFHLTPLRGGRGKSGFLLMGRISRHMCTKLLLLYGRIENPLPFKGRVREGMG